MTEPIKDKLKSKLLGHISCAKTSIRIAVAWFTDSDLLRALTQQVRKGIDVEVILSNDAKNFTESYSLDFSDFKNAGGKLYIWEESFFHSKFCIIDRECVFSGSANYTYNGFHKNHEITLLIKDPISIEWFIKEFEAITDFFREGKGLILSPLKFFYKKEIGALYERITWLEAEIVKAEKYVQQYEVLYRLHFQALIREILYMRKLKAEKQHQLIEKPETKKEKVEADRLWDTFSQNIENDELQGSQLGNELLQNSLRDLYRAAVKLCHPDNPNIPEDRKDLASKVFLAIKKAYDENDEDTLKSLLEDLKSGLSLNKLDYENPNFYWLESIYIKLKIKYDTLVIQLDYLHSDTRYKVILSQNFESHFKGKKVVLEEELRVLKEEVQ